MLLLLYFGRDVAGLAAEAKGESFPIEDEGGASLARCIRTLWPSDIFTTGDGVEEDAAAQERILVFIASCKFRYAGHFLHQSQIDSLSLSLSTPPKPTSWRTLFFILYGGDREI
jgi:hypothetical protein